MPNLRLPLLFLTVTSACQASEPASTDWRSAATPAVVEDDRTPDVIDFATGSESGTTGEESGACCGYLDLWIECWDDGEGIYGYEDVYDCVEAEGDCHLAWCVNVHQPDCCYEEGSRCWGDIIVSAWCPVGTTGRCGSSFDQEAPGCDNWPEAVEPE